MVVRASSLTPIVTVLAVALAPSPFKSHYSHVTHEIVPQEHTHTYKYTRDASGRTLAWSIPHPSTQAGPRSFRNHKTHKQGGRAGRASDGGAYPTKVTSPKHKALTAGALLTPLTTLSNLTSPQWANSHVTHVVVPQ